MTVKNAADSVLEKIMERVGSYPKGFGFLDAVFGERKQDVLNGTPVILFGAGAAGKDLCLTLRAHDVQPILFCDNDSSRHGSLCCGIPVISFDELVRHHHEAIVVIASPKHLLAMCEQLLESGFKSEQIMCKASDKLAPLVFMYSNHGTQVVLSDYKYQCLPLSVSEYLEVNQQLISRAYDLLADQHSRNLFIAKWAIVASEDAFQPFCDFITSYSQPVLDYGWTFFDWTTEDYYYFTNDVFSLSPNEVYVDVGAYDGDTVHTFVEACKRNNVDYQSIYAYEPDPDCYRALLRNTAQYPRVTCYQLGVWSQSARVTFTSSKRAVHDQAGRIDPTGDIEVDVVALDEHLPAERVSLIKMDPAGDVIPHALLGAAGIIARDRPKLAVGAYHSVRSLFEIPLLVHRLCPEYELFLRHNTNHLCDTDLLARPR
ncbi:FkbM family methyltransferase [Desulfosoma sp.]